MFRNFFASVQLSQSESVESVASKQDYLILDNKAYSVLKRIPCASLRDGDAEYLICTCEFKIYWIRHIKVQQNIRNIQAYSRQLPFIGCAKEQGQKYNDYVLFAFSHTKMKNWKRVCAELEFAKNLLRIRALFSSVVQLHSKKEAHGNLCLENVFEQDEREWWLGDYNRSSTNVTMDMDVMDLAAIVLEFALQQKIPPLRTEQALLAQFEKLSAQQKEDLAALEFFIRKQISLVQMSKVVDQWVQKFYRYQVTLNRGFQNCSSYGVFKMLLKHLDKPMTKKGMNVVYYWL